MRRLMGVLGLIAILAVGACAKGPKAVDALMLAPPVPADRSRLVIMAPSLLDGLSQGEVFVNRRRIGPVDAYGALYTDVEPGTQVIAIDRQQARSTALYTEPGEMVFVTLSSIPGTEWIGLYEPTRVPEDVGRETLRGLRMAEWAD